MDTANSKTYLGLWSRTAMLLLMALFWTNCLDEIDLAQGIPLPEGIVVSGRLLAGEEFNEAEVILEELFRFEESNRPAQVVTADVSIVNGDGQSMELTFRDGKYSGSLPANDPSFLVEDGMTYSVNVRTREGGTYFSEEEVLLPALEPTNASVEMTEIETVNLIGNPVFLPAIEYRISSPIRYADGSPAYLRWLMNETYQQTDESRDTVTGIKTCYTSVAFEGLKVKVASSPEGAAQITDFSLGKNRIDFGYAEGNYMVVRQESISRRAFDYFDQVRQIASTELSIFEAPGGPVIGNIAAGDESITNVYGYFYVARPAIIRIPVTPEEAGNPTLACPLLVDMPPPVSRCTDCLTVRNSTIVRPEWWNL